MKSGLSDSPVMNKVDKDVVDEKELHARGLASGFLTRHLSPQPLSSAHACKCGRTISGNKNLCLDCRLKETLEV